MIRTAWRNFRVPAAIVGTLAMVLVVGGCSSSSTPEQKAAASATPPSPEASTASSEKVPDAQSSDSSETSDQVPVKPGQPLVTCCTHSIVTITNHLPLSVRLSATLSPDQGWSYPRIIGLQRDPSQPSPNGFSGDVLQPGESVTHGFEIMRPTTDYQRNPFTNTDNIRFGYTMYFYSADKGALLASPELEHGWWIMHSWRVMAPRGWSVPGSTCDMNWCKGDSPIHYTEKNGRTRKGTIHISARATDRDQTLTDIDLLPWTPANGENPTPSASATAP